MSNHPYKFTIYKSDQPTSSGWYELNGNLDQKTIQEIKNVNGANSKRGMTSVPSPFARMHLMATAFSHVYEARKTAQLKGENMYYKLVSYTLDLLEIIHNSTANATPLEFSSWNLNNQIEQLKGSRNEGSRFLAASLDLYRKQNEKFKGMQEITLIKCNHKVIGATSPFSLVFPASNVEEGLEGYFKRIVPLHERSLDFQKYIWRLYYANKGEFAYSFKSFADYIVAASEMNKEIKQYTLENQSYDLSDYRRDFAISLKDSNEQAIQIAGIELRIPEESVNIESDFQIVPNREKQISGKIPLVLKNKTYGGWKYINGRTWEINTEVQDYYDTPVSERTLPDTPTKYPFLTIGDFFEKELVMLGAEGASRGIDADSFLSPLTGEDFPYLLPIKKTYFDYFSIQDLQQHLTVEVRSVPTNMDRKMVTVKLEIPVKRNGGFDCVTFTKKYDHEPAPQQNEFDQVGKIINADVDLSIFPFVVTDNPEIDNYFKVKLVDYDNEYDQMQHTADMSFYKVGMGGITALDAKPTVRLSKDKDDFSDIYAELKECFDVIELTVAAHYQGNEVKGLILPLWKRRNTNGSTFNFGIDFGTSNTHIAFNTSPNEQPKPFNITKNEKLLANLCKDNIPFKERQFVEFIPDDIGGDSMFKFPTRTAVAESRDFEGTPDMDVFGNINIAFAYQRLCVEAYHTVKTDIKWNAKLRAVDKQRLNAFFKEVLLLLKYKVIAKEGNLSQTKVTWFFPLSLPRHSFQGFKEIWESTYMEVFGVNSTQNISHLTESIAPYLYLKTKHKANFTPDVLNIDIGGGSTDVLFVENGQPISGTSFRFAGNAIWGEGYNALNERDNGFILAYLKMWRESGVADNLKACFPDVTQLDFQLITYLEQLLHGNPSFENSSDIMGFIFLLEEKFPTITNSMKDMLNQMPQLRFVLYLHYTATLYHIAQYIVSLYKKKGGAMKIPSRVCFSGKGSSYLSLLTDNFRLQEICKYIFGQVFEASDLMLPTDFQLIIPDEPKEATANGGVFKDDSIKVLSIKPDTYLGTTSGFDQASLVAEEEDDDTDIWGAFGTAVQKSTDKQVASYQKVVQNKALEDDVIQNVINFIGIAIKYPDLQNDRDWMGMSKERMKALTSFMGANDFSVLRQGYGSAVNDNKGHVHDGEKITESLFFAPLINLLYLLSKEVVLNDVE